MTHSVNAALASSVIFSTSSVLRGGLIARASPSSYTSASASTTALSRGMMIVPLDLRLPSRGRTGFFGAAEEEASCDVVCDDFDCGDSDG